MPDSVRLTDRASVREPVDIPSFCIHNEAEVGITAAAMKVLAFFPLTYLAGVHGFALFAPYLGLFLVVAHFLRRARKSREVKVIPITISVERVPVMNGN